MRLKSIKLAGFKSFVDPTTVHFPSNMCAVVGPNGCGKSNVIDAVRWVMGESSAKNLRGESMADVIFNGSVNRQPVGQASIELIFDNSDGGVGGEYAGYSEISIKRLVTRDAQSEYFLNGTRCRRRDITDIFLGTGLGPRSYAIIEQGMISRLVESRPEDLRVFVEEAAGISKYKERRKETESRMRRTMENLERLTDLRDELGRQLQHLQRQAQAAEKYREFREEERTLRAQLQALQWQDLDARVGEAAQAIGELEVRLEAVHAEHQQVDTAIEGFRVEHADCTDAFNAVQARYYALGAEVARLEQTLKHQQERGRQLRDDLARTVDDLGEAEAHLREDRGRLEAWDRELGELAPEREQSEAREQASAEALLQAEEGMHHWQQEWDEFNHRAAQPRQQAEVQQSRIRHLEQVLQRARNRIGQLEEEQASLAPGPADDEIAALEERRAEAELHMAGHEAACDTLVGQIAATRDRGVALSAELDEARSALQRMRGRQASLEALQQAAREDAGEAAAGWLRARQLEDRPRLLQRLQVDEGWQLAVETVLGEDLQAVCVDAVGPLGALLGELNQGHLALVESSPDLPGTPGWLAARARGAGDLLAGIRTAESLEEAMALRSALASGESVITRDGLWLGRDWMRIARPADGEGGIIRRQQELERLGIELAQGQERERELAAALADSQEELKAQDARRQQHQRELQTSTRLHADLSAQLSAHHAKVEQINARRERLAAEMSEVQEQFRHEQESIAEARQLLAVAIESMEGDSRRREELLVVRDRTRATLDAARQQARHDKDAAHQLAIRHQSLQTQAGAMRDAIARLESQVAQLRERRDMLDAGIADNDSPAAGLQAELEQQLELRLQAETELSAARQAVAELEHRLREAEQRRVAIEHRANGVRNELEQCRLSNQTLQVQRQTLSSQLAESGHQPAEVLQALPEGANESDWQRSLEQVANRIARLGPINLAAIDEFSLQSERKTYLDAQNEDLETALETLQNAIRKIDRETRNRFRETFDRVNSGLQELFPRVFGGGSAYLEMTGEDLLDTGISIMARPPGKKNSTIHLLSGGEKALTAIALVFSIFQLNPAPFCMLDEVDAPLDDANVGRYARMVKEMSDQVQFIYITHNKISMEMADQLMGVTMHEPGVSRLVTVDVEEAAELAAS